MALDEKFDRFLEDYNAFRIEDARWKGGVDARLDKALKTKTRAEYLSAVGVIIGGIFAGWFGGRASGG